MRKLYLKIVVAIWAVMIISSLVVGLVIRATGPERPDRSARSAVMGELPWDRMLEKIVETASSATSGQGEAALVEWFRDAPMTARMADLVLVDANGNEILHAKTSASRHARNPAGSPEIRPRSLSFDHDGRRYRITVTPRAPGDMLRPGKLQRLVAFLVFRPEYTWLLLVIAIPLSAGLSFLIARYLVSPLRSFEQAGRKLSEGDFAVRIAPSLGNRGDEIADFAATFDQMAVRIEALIRSHKVLLRDVSHELRSPLARVQAAVSLARQRTRGAVDEELESIECEIDRLNAMIGKLLTFSRLDAKQAPLNRESIDVDGLLADIVGETSVEARAGNKHIDLRVLEPCTVSGDPELLASSFENVIRNAIRHTPQNSSVEVSLFGQASGRGCRVEVRDYGDGVADEELRRIFDPFYRTDDGRNAQSGGSGIGLAIASRAVHLHGGTIDASNAPDGGLVVSIRLPFTNADLS